MPEADLNAITILDRQTLEKRILFEGYIMTWQAFVAAVGSDVAIEAMIPHMKASGEAFVKNMDQIFHIEGDDFERIVKITQMWEDFLGIGHKEVLRAKSEVIRIGNPECPLRYCPKEGCIFGHVMMLNGIAEAINPDYHCRALQLVHDGDPLCEIMIYKDTG
jgi:hypothetical protein